MNILNYIDTNNKVIDEINEVDALILSRFSYIHLEMIKDILPIKIKDLLAYANHIKINKRDRVLLTKMANSKRFGNIIIKRIQNVLDEKRGEQFYAITYKLSFNTIFVAYRGTTKDLVDFKEDMDMSYKIVPAQIDALNYLNNENIFNNIYLGGHSKGGNLAMYAAINADYLIQKRIKKIYNFDGPGFLELDDNYLKIKNKIINFYPENDIVGMLLLNDSERKIIKTEKGGIESHNLYNWMIDNNMLVSGKLHNLSKKFHEQNLLVVDSISSYKKEVIINYLFDLIKKGNIKNIKDLTLNDVKKIIMNIPSIEKQEKKYMLDMMYTFLELAFNLPNFEEKNLHQNFKNDKI